MARTLPYNAERSNLSRHIHLVTDFKGKTFNIQPLHVTLAISFSIDTFLRLK